MFWEKYCLSCMKKIHLLAGRCPYCREEGKTEHGRLAIVTLLVMGLLLGSWWYLEQKQVEKIPAWRYDPSMMLEDSEQRSNVRHKTVVPRRRSSGDPERELDELLKSVGM